MAKIKSKRRARLLSPVDASTPVAAGKGKKKSDSPAANSPGASRSKSPASHSKSATSQSPNRSLVSKSAKRYIYFPDLRHVFN